MNTQKTTGYRYDLSWLTLVKAFWNEKFLAAVVTIIVASIGIASVRRMPAIYKADALVLVDTQKIPERFVSTTVTSDLQDRLSTISQEILSSPRLIKIIHDFNLYPEDRKRLVQDEILEIMRKDLEVMVEKSGGNRPSAFRISYQGRDPVIVAAVANQVSRLYIEENLRTREVQAEGTSEFIETQLQEAKKQLDQLEASVGRYKIQHNGELPQQETSLSATLSRLQTELTGSQDAISRTEQSKMLLQNSLAAAENAEATLTKTLRSDGDRTASGDMQILTAIAPPRQPTQAEQLSAKLQALRSRYSDEHPSVKEAIRDLEQARAAELQQETDRRQDIPAATANVRKASPLETAALASQLQQARERTAGLRSQLAVLTREIEMRQADRRRIISDLNTYQSRLERLPLREQEMAALTRDYEISKGNYRSLLDKRIAAEMASDLERRQKAEKFTILDPARVPQKPIKPNRPALYAAYFFGSLVLGIVLAMAKGLSQDKVLGEWELPKDVALLGRVPRIELSPTVGEDNPRGILSRSWKVGFFAVFTLLGATAWAWWIRV